MNFCIKYNQSMIKQDPFEMIRYFADFLTEINLIITTIKEYIYQIIDVHLSSHKNKNVMYSMPSVILSTHRTFDDLKKIQSILSGVIQSKRITSKNSSFSTFKRSKTTYSRMEIMDKHQASEQLTGTNEVRTVKRKVPKKNQIKQVLQRSASSQQGIKKQNNKSPTENFDIKTIKNVIQRGMQHSSSEIVFSKTVKSNKEDRVASIIKDNGISLAKILQVNNQCLKIVRSARKQLNSKKK